MTKQEFISQLGNDLAGLPHDDIQERLTFYGEMIDDYIEDGLTEEQAVAQVGQIDEIVAQVVADTPLSKIAKERIKANRRLKTWETILLILGSPIWVSLGIATVAVIISLYVSLWAIIISLWSVFGSLAGSCVGAIAGGIVIIFQGNTLTGVAMLGAALVCIGLSIFAFYGCKAATRGIIKLTRKAVIHTKNCFIKKGEA